MKTLRPIIGWAAIDDAKVAGAARAVAVAARAGGVAAPGDAAGAAAAVRPLDARVVALVAGVAARGSLAAAALALRLPYRTAWALLRDAETDLRRPLLALARGRGAKPTALGERLLAADRAARDLLAARAPELAVPLRTVPGPRPGRVLRVAAAHDLALAELRDLWRARHRVAVSFTAAPRRSRCTRRAASTSPASTCWPDRAARTIRGSVRSTPRGRRAALRRARAGADPAAR